MDSVDGRLPAAMNFSSRSIPVVVTTLPGDVPSSSSYAVVVTLVVVLLDVISASPFRVCMHVVLAA